MVICHWSIVVDRSEGNAPYAIPPSNPFFGLTTGRPEIFALGLRNPFRFSFDFWLLASGFYRFISISPGAAVSLE